MTAPFLVHMLPARFGDAILAEYGTRSVRRRILIDGGPLEAYPEMSRALADKLPDGDQRVELLVITHVDTDHVEGVIRHLAMPKQQWGFEPKEVWFNGWRHLVKPRTLGGREGEVMSALIARRASDRWNTAYGKKAVRMGGVFKDEVTLDDEFDEPMRLTLLSPTPAELTKLKTKWKASAATWKIAPGDLDKAWAALVKQTKFHPGAELTLGSDDLSDKLRKLLKGIDPSEANGSSIAFLARYGGKSCLFLGDAHMKVVCASLRKLGVTKKNPLVVDGVKLSHHGSKNNITPEFIDLVDARHWLVSTNGEKHGHPEPNAIQAVIDGATRKPPELWFNYRVPATERWAKGNGKWVAHLPKKGEEGITVEL